MYVVIFEKNILYLGKNIKKTIEIFSKKNNAEIFRVNDIEELYKLIENPNDFSDEPVSETTQELLKKLDGIELGEIKIESITEKQLTKVACVGVNSKSVPPEFLIVNNDKESDGENTYNIREYLKNHDL